MPSFAAAMTRVGRVSVAVAVWKSAAALALAPPIQPAGLVASCRARTRLGRFSASVGAGAAEFGVPTQVGAEHQRLCSFM